MKKRKIKKIKKLKVKKLNLRNKVKPQRRFKIRYKRLLLFLLILSLIIYLCTTIFKFPIKNIYIYNNNYLSDQEIIDMAGLDDYPSIFHNLSYQIENKLEKSIYIKKAEIKKSKLSKIEITITENRPLFYYLTDDVTVFENSKTIKGEVVKTTVVNYIPDTIYKDFLSSMKNIETNVLEKISEIEYSPNSVDEERFLLTMIDGNYVYINIENFKSLNSYINIYADIIETYGYKKGILYLDSGEYFTIIE